MTLANLLKLAHEELADDKAHRSKGGMGWYDDARAQRALDRATALATAISSLLTAETCGWERPEVVGYRSALGGDEPRMIAVPSSWATRVTPADARVMAVMLLRAADSAEENQ